MALSSVADDTEEERSLLQNRLVLFGASSFVFFVFMAGMSLLLGAVFFPDAVHRLRTPPYNLPLLLAGGPLFLVCRRGKLALPTLLVLDTLVTVAIGTGAGMALVVASPELTPAIQTSLGLTDLLVLRAVLVPGNLRRTLWIGVLAAAPGIVLASWFGLHGGWHLHPLWGVLLPTWIAAAIGLSAFTSHVIYRLRRRVAAAQTLGRYTLEEKIGEGGMGVVFRARHAMLRRPTVVKLLPPDKAGAANIARFEREVQLTSQLTSPHTVAIYDFGRTPDGIFYYAMEHLDGTDLERLVAENGPQPAGRVIHVLLGICASLAEAHDRGLVHRDIKPSNVMLCRHGGNVDLVKVLDFGLVKDVAGGKGTDLKLTKADALIGTPFYMSPEGLTDAERVDARSDVYAVGAVGYFLLAGRPPFEGTSMAEVSAHHLFTTPEPLAGVAADLERVILGCLAKEQAERPPTARALRALLLTCADAGRWNLDDLGSRASDAPR